MNGNPAVPAGGFTLAIVALRDERDLVSLRRRARAAAEEFGLAGRDLRSLPAATYEAARLLFGTSRSATATVQLAEGPALEVVVRVSTAADPEGAAALREHIAAGIEALRSMVDRLDIEQTDGLLSVCLRSELSKDGAPRVEHLRRTGAAAGKSRSPTGGDQPGDLGADHAALHRAFVELQTELEETNRGVVALYAELESQTERLRQAEDRLRLLLDSVQDYAICMLTSDGNIASWNSGAERLFSYSADEIIGRHFSCFYPAVERDLGVPAEHVRTARETGRFESEGIRLRRGGAAFDAHVLLTPVCARSGELRGFSLVVRDITERKRLEDDLRRRADELAAANRAKEDFLATLSHELRTPLNAMLGWTRLLRSGGLDAAAMARALETIERNAHIQEQLIADILDLSRIVTGKLRLELRPIDLAPVVEAAVDAVSPTALAKGIHLVSDTHVPGVVLGDPDRLQQVAWNLLSNAIKFTPTGGTVRVALSQAGASLVLTVEDTGEGIAADLLPFIFDRFTQGDASVTRPHGGLGLGLSIVRHIVELHGGWVHATSRGPGLGASFSVYLPVRGNQLGS